MKLTAAALFVAASATAYFYPARPAPAAADAAPAAPASPAPRAAPPGPWARKTLAAMTLEQKVGQMIGVRAYGLFRNRRAPEHRALLDQVRKLRVGCVTVFESEVEAIPPLVNELQDAAAVPLLKIGRAHA